MILTAKIKLITDKLQGDALKRTLETTNAACGFLSKMAWDQKVFARFKLQKIGYAACRQNFPALSSQIVIRAMAKVADAYKLDKKTMRTFKPHGAISYDSRILSWNLASQTVSIWTVDGRLKISFAAGKRQLELLGFDRGEADLCYIGNEWYLFVSCKFDDPKPIDVVDVLGIDLGIVNLATDSDGVTYSGTSVEINRKKFSHRRRNLQRKGTKAAKRKLKQISGRQARLQSDVNHVISKRVVNKAKDTSRSIGLEDLTGIRERVTVRRAQRARHANWAFFQLKSYISYKAACAGVPVIYVDPRNTSRCCNVCGCIDKANRRSQSEFRCVTCGRVDLADHNAALNIRSRASADVKRQMVTLVSNSVNHGSYKLPVLTGSI